MRRYFNENGAIADMIYNQLSGPSHTMVDPLDPTHRRHFSDQTKFDDLLIPVVHDGSVIGAPESLETIRARVQKQLAMFHRGVLRLENPHKYPVGLEAGLYDLKTELVLAARASSPSAT